MPTNLDLDDALIREVVKLGRFRSKKDAVNTALTEYINKRARRQLTELFGTIHYDPDYDYKALRSRKKGRR
jgi:hypothetical protein